MAGREKDPVLVALEEELAGYVRYGRDDRAAEVRAAIKALNGEPKAPAKTRAKPASSTGKEPQLH